MTMDEWKDSSAHNERPHPPDPSCDPRSSAQKRTRVAGAKNLKNHEVAWLYQHYLRRTKEQKDTVFFIHGVKQDFNNIWRKIRRLKDAQLEPIEDSMSLPQLPSYIELRSPTPELTQAQAPEVDMVDPERNREWSPQPPEEVPTSTGPQKSHIITTESEEITFEGDEDDIRTAGNAFLGNIPLSEILDGLFETNWGEPTRTSLSFNIGRFGPIHAHHGGFLGTMINELHEVGYRENRMSHLEMILTLVSESYVSTSHFLEAVIRNVNGEEVEILNWLSQEIDIPKFGARALGTAANLNNFEAVNMLLDIGVNIKGSVFSPHPHPFCRCQTSVMAYAEQPRFDREDPGASDEMIEYLLGRGAAQSIGVGMDLLCLLGCALRQHRINDSVFFSKIQAIVEGIHGFAEATCKTESLLEVCIQESEQDFSCVESRLRVFEYLLDQGAKTSFGSPLSALIHYHGPQSLVEKLLVKTENIDAYCNSVIRNDTFARINVIPPPYGIVHYVNPLQAAALHGNEGMVKLLLDHGADVNCQARGFGGVTPLQAICSWETNLPEELPRKREIVALLIMKKANVNAAPAWHAGFTALQAAAIVGDVALAEILVGRGADVNSPACKYGGGTALAMAVKKGHKKMVRFLLEKGVKIPAIGARKVVLEFLRGSHVKIPLKWYPRTSSRDYHEYEAEWAADPTYESRDFNSQSRQ